jgi:hypothetical protein
MTWILVIFTVVIMALLFKIIILQAENEYWRMEADHERHMKMLHEQMSKVHFKMYEDAQPEE